MFTIPQLLLTQNEKTGARICAVVSTTRVRDKSAFQLNPWNLRKLTVSAHTHCIRSLLS